MRKGWRWTLGAVGGTSLIALVGGLKLGWDYDRVAHELPKAARDYRAAGLPWTAAELAPFRLSAEENAAGPLIQAIAALPTGRSRLLSGEEGTEAALKHAHLAAQRKGLQFDRDWDLGQAMPLPELTGVRALIRILTQRATSYGARGDDIRALADLRDARRLAGLIGQDPTLLSAFASASGETTVMRAARVCLENSTSDPRRIGLYRAFIAEPAYLPDLRRAMRSMAYLAVATGRNLSRMGLGRGVSPGFEGFAQEIERRAGVAPPPLLRDGLPQSTRQRAYLVRALRSWTELARRTDGLTDSIEKIGEVTWKIAERPIPPLSMSHNLDAILFPRFWGLGNTNRDPRTHQALALAEADALLLHARTGHWPAATTIGDPWGTGPLRLRVDSGGFRVWSVGPNGRDDGGRSWSEAREAGRYSDDTVFTISRPGSRKQPFVKLAP